MDHHGLAMLALLATAKMVAACKQAAIHINFTDGNSKVV